MAGKRKPKDDEESVTSETKQPIKNVPALMGEGEKFFRDQLYTKAIQCYTEVLELSPSNKNALVERAACYLKIGKNNLALADAEESLQENKEFTKGLYQKAEALYAMGEFELALVFYHRGKKLRSDVREFQLGINKAQEAIDNCVGDPNSVKLEVKGDLSYFDKPDEKMKNKKKVGGGYSKPYVPKQSTVAAKREKRPIKVENQKTVKQLLGELYADKVYLEQLLEDDRVTRQNTRAGDAIWSLANNGLDFLDSRTEFWRQQKPIYARKRGGVYSSSSGFSSKSPQAYILKQLEIIDNLQAAGKHRESLDKSNSLMSYVNRLSDTQLADKKSTISNVYCYIGNAYLEMGHYDDALQAHQKDLEISKQIESQSDISRAYENIGRVYARNGKYKEAVQVWEKKMPLAESDQEKTWLFHEIGRCHLEMGNYEVAKDYGEKSLACAKSIDDEVWILNATVLIAQSQVKIGDVQNLENGIENFEKALKLTENQNDISGTVSIKQRLAECREKLKKLQIDTPREGRSNSPKKVADTNQGLQQRRTSSPKRKTSSPKRKTSSPTNAKKTNEKNETYSIEVKTSDEMSAGTDANVFISIYGSEDNLLDVPLTNPKESKNMFEAGKTDLFSVTNKAVGKIKKIKVSQDGKGLGSSWKVESVKIDADKESYFFAINKWLDSSQLSVEVEPSNSESGLTTYKVEVKTADEMSAGTDANVKLTIFGTLKDIIDAPLEKSENNKNSFENGQTDLFTLRNPVNVGKIKKIRVSQDGKGFGASWKLESVDIHVNNDSYTFDINTWLDSSKLFIESEPTDKESGIVAYKIEVKTADDLSSGTDAKVKLSIYGTLQDILDIPLSKSENNKNPFENGQNDMFTIRDPVNVGKIKKINIGHDGKGLGSSWKIESVKIIHEKQSYIFKADRWLDKSQGDKAINIDLVPESSSSPTISPTKSTKK